MIKKLILINLLLLVIATVLVYHLDANLKKERGRDLAQVGKTVAGAKKPSPPAADKKDKPASSMPQPPLPAPSWEPDYRIVADKNLFSEDRSLTKPVPKEEPKIPELNPKPVLTGIINLDNKRIAFVEDGGPATTPATTPITKPAPAYPRPATPMPPASPSTGARRNTIHRLEIGSDYQGYKVTEIADTSLTLTYGENKRSETFQLFARDKRPARPAGPGGYVAPQPPIAAVPGAVPQQVFTVGGSNPSRGAMPGQPQKPGVPGMSQAPVPGRPASGVSSASGISGVSGSTSGVTPISSGPMTPSPSMQSLTGGTPAKPVVSVGAPAGSTTPSGTTTPPSRQTYRDRRR